MDTKDAKSVDTDTEIETPETRYFKMMMQDNEIGRVELGVDSTDADSIIGGQTIASLMQDGKIAVAAREPSTAESLDTNEQSTANEQSTLSIVGYDDVSTLANDTVDETTKAFFTGNGNREDSKPRMRLFKEYKTPEKKKKSGSEGDEETQPETPPGMIKVRSSHNSNSSRDEEALSTNGKMKTLFLRSRQRVYLVAGGLALILFIAIIALAVALRGVRGPGSTGSSSSVIEAASGDNGLLDIWPELDAAIGNDEEPVVNNGEPTNKPVSTSPGPTASPTVPPPTLEPTVDETAEIMFAEAASLLEDFGIIKQKDLEKRSDSVQYKSALWLSQDPNYFEYSEDRLIQRWSLAVIAQSLDPTIEVTNSLRARQLQVVGGLLPGWLTYTDECSWFSVGSTGSPCDKDGMYTTLDLQGLMLGGTLATEIGLLSKSLQHILLGGNELTGKIPDVIENLTNLVSLRLRRNNLEGRVKVDFTKLASLEIFDVGENKLTGSLQYEILDLNSPTEIYLDNNNLDGDIPWRIGDLDTLSTLTLEGNSFTGWIPDTLGDLKGLTVLTLGENDFEGKLPKDVCKLKNLETLSVDCAAQGCDCCTECATTNAPTPSPTSEPTQSPTFSPTANPTTMSPTSSPTASPTISPTSAPLPTSSPTVCVPQISVSDFCFAPGVNIEIDVSNCDSLKDDWVAIYRVDQLFDRNNLSSNSSLWSWACGTQNCNIAVDQLTIAMGDIHTDHVHQWPLEPGLYTAILARNTAEPYEATAVSDTFVVAEQC